MNLPTFRIKNWRKFQHYKDDRPLRWIKLHLSLLTDYDFRSLPDTSKAHLVMLWLLAGSLQNKIPDDANYLKELTGCKSKPDLDLLERSGFIVRSRTESYSASESSVKQRREEERRVEKRREEKSKSGTPDGFAAALALYPARGRRRTDKPKALATWKKRKLEPNRVMLHIQADLDSEDWQKDNGQFVPGFHRYLAGRDFDADPTTDQTPLSRLSPKGQKSARALARWLEEQGG